MKDVNQILLELLKIHDNFQSDSHSNSIKWFRLYILCLIKSIESLKINWAQVLKLFYSMYDHFLNCFNKYGENINTLHVFFVFFSCSLSYDLSFELSWPTICSLLHSFLLTFILKMSFFIPAFLFLVPMVFILHLIETKWPWWTFNSLPTLGTHPTCWCNP